MFQQQAERIAHELQLHNLDAASYHAGLPIKERQRVQSLFMEDKLKIVVATVGQSMNSMSFFFFFCKLTEFNASIWNGN